MSLSRKLSIEMILGIFGTFIALCALGLSIWQAQATLRHNHVSVEPRLSIYFSNDAKKGKFGLYVTNNGLGPAYIDQFRLLVNGKLPVSGFRCCVVAEMNNLLPHHSVFTPRKLITWTL